MIDTRLLLPIMPGDILLELNVKREAVGAPHLVAQAEHQEFHIGEYGIQRLLFIENNTIYHYLIGEDTMWWITIARFERT